MKIKEWINGNKMKFESLHKTFNNKVDCISQGNVMGNVQLSGYVRSFNETKCNGFTSEKGHLQEYDLGWLLKGLPGYVKNYIRKIAIDKMVCAYHFFYYQNRERIDIGYVITDYTNNLLRAFYVGGYKREDALNEAIKYIIN